MPSQGTGKVYFGLKQQSKNVVLFPKVFLVPEVDYVFSLFESENEFGKKFCEAFPCAKKFVAIYKNNGWQTFFDLFL